MPHRKADLDTTTPFGRRRSGFVDRLAWTLATAAGLSQATRKRVRKHFGGARPGPFDVAVDGVSFRVYPAENRCDRVLMGRRTLPEPHEHALLRPLLAPQMVFVDIGANIGTYALWVAARAGPAATVLAFEPHPRTFAKLTFNRAANDAENVVLRNAAVAGETGVMRLVSDGGGNIGNASLATASADVIRDAIEVAVVPLASVAAELGIGRIDLLKIDVEGFEDRALLPLFDQAPESLWPRAILIETALSSLWQRDCLAELARRGYLRIAATGENVLLRRFDL